jgi:hypothetical protein
MTYLITPADRAAFQRCPRQWDFGASGRQNLETLNPPRAPDLGRALREALDIYYFPGMWDWPRPITLPLVRQGFERALATQREQAPDAGGDAVWQPVLETGQRLLERYVDWAPGVDRFSPVQVGAEYDVTLLDPAHPGRALLTPGGQAIRYRGRIGMLAVDANDAYWILTHRLVEGDWPPAGELAADEEGVAACWAWEQFYLGMAIAGTIYNEVRADVPDQPGVPARPRRDTGRGRWRPSRRRDRPQRVSQHEPSGGGRSIPQHRRMYAVAREPDEFERIEQQSSAQFRRTWVRRDPAEVAEAGRGLAEAAAQMTAAKAGVEPSPSPAICPSCAYLAPCQAMMAGRAVAPLLRSGYRERATEKLDEGRLGGAAWSTGRGAAPLRFRGTR